MEKLRIRERNIINDKIKKEEISNKVDTKSITNLKNALSSSFNTMQIEKILFKIESRKNTIENLKNRLESLDKGLLDDKIQEEIKNNTPVIQKKCIIKKTKKPIVKNNEEKRITEKEYNKSYKYFCNVCNSIPDYILAKLKQMPNNKGYIWRGVYCYGNKKPEKDKPIVMFEKTKLVFIIHEWYKNEYKIWHKKGSNPKFLYSIKKY